MKPYLENLWRKLHTIQFELSLCPHFSHVYLPTYLALYEISLGFLELAAHWENMQDGEREAVREMCQVLGLITDIEMEDMVEEAEAVAEIRKQERADEVSREVASHGPGGEL